MIDSTCLKITNCLFVCMQILLVCIYPLISHTTYMTYMMTMLFSQMIVDVVYNNILICMYGTTLFPGICSTLSILIWHMYYENSATFMFLAFTNNISYFIIDIHDLYVIYQQYNTTIPVTTKDIINQMNNFCNIKHYRNSVVQGWLLFKICVNYVLFASLFQFYGNIILKALILIQICLVDFYILYHLS